jgi:hypothetical protein
MQGPTRSGYSTCRENSISGVGRTPKGSKCAWRTVATTRAIERRLSTGELSSGPILLWSLESRVRNERRMLGSERGYGRPGVERPYGARSLLYSIKWLFLDPLQVQQFAFYAGPYKTPR